MGPEESLVRTRGRAGHAAARTCWGCCWTLVTILKAILFLGWNNCQERRVDTYDILRTLVLPMGFGSLPSAITALTAWIHRGAGDLLVIYDQASCSLLMLLYMVSSPLGYYIL